MQSLKTTADILCNDLQDIAESLDLNVLDRSIYSIATYHDFNFKFRESATICVEISLADRIPWLEQFAENSDTLKTISDLMADCAEFTVNLFEVCDLQNIEVKSAYGSNDRICVSVDIYSKPNKYGEL